MGMLAGLQHSGPSRRPLRVSSGLEPALPTRYIVTASVRDTAPLVTERIYVHIDMDVLDPEEVSGHPLTVPGGPRAGSSPPRHRDDSVRQGRRTRDRFDSGR